MQIRFVVFGPAFILFVATCSSSGSRPESMAAGNSGNSIASSAYERDTAFIETSRGTEAGTWRNGKCTFSDSNQVRPSNDSMGTPRDYSLRTVSANWQSCRFVVARGYRHEAVMVDAAGELEEQQRIRFDSTKQGRWPEKR